LVQHKPKEGSLWWKICGGTGAHTHQGLIFFVDVTSCTIVRRRRQAKFQTLRRILLREYGLGFFKCMSDSHVVCRSAIAGKIPGEAMASAFILAKSSRSPLKKLPDRLIPAAAIGNGDRPPSPQGEGGNHGQDMLPPPSPGHGGSDQWPPSWGREVV
jgi:hypothetical protein